MVSGEGPASSRTTTVAWWLHGTGELCVFCLQTFGHGAGRWCVACDRAVCPCCVKHGQGLSREVRCPDCPDESEEP
jgi:hypothetical protein